MKDRAVELLLVEDNAEDIELTLRALNQLKLSREIFVVRSGDEALDFLFSSGKYSGEPRKLPRVILLDLKLPKIDGFEVLRRIKSDRKTSTVPVVVLTSSREERDIARSYSLGVNSYVVKPVDFERFVQSVSELGLYWLLRNETSQEL